MNPVVFCGSASMALFSFAILRLSPVLATDSLAFIAVELAFAFIVFGALFWRRAKMKASVKPEMNDVSEVETSGRFKAMVGGRFDEWNLTPAERDVAWFTIKGLSIAEIADLRGTSDGTIKAQSNAIYRKADVGNRLQLVALFVEDLVAADFGPRPLDGKPSMAEALANDPESAPIADRSTARAA